MIRSAFGGGTCHLPSPVGTHLAGPFYRLSRRPPVERDIEYVCILVAPSGSSKLTPIFRICPAFSSTFQFLANANLSVIKTVTHSGICLPFSLPILASWEVGKSYSFSSLHQWRGRMDRRGPI